MIDDKTLRIACTQLTFSRNKEDNLRVIEKLASKACDSVVRADADISRDIHVPFSG